MLLLIIVQVARVRDLAKKLRGSEEIEAKATESTGKGLLFFMVALLVITTVSAIYYKNYILGFGPHQSASVHGEEIDSMMKWTLGVTYVTYILTHIALFYYAFKYRSRKGRKAQYMSHNNTVELVWTGIPAIVMTFLVVGGLDAWNEIMSDVGEDDNYMEIEATGYQFAWQMRYPGPDGLLGRRDFRLITGANPLGQDWSDPKNHDDILVNDVTLPVDQKVRVRIIAKDVLHDFYLPQFRVKMDAVPGLPTYFVFTPRLTTKEWRKGLSEYPEYQELDPESDSGQQLWETRNFELACAELCGIGHWSMARTVTIMEQDEFDTWYAGQTSYYEANIKGTEYDPLFMANVEERRNGLKQAVSQAMETPGNDDNYISLDHVSFEDGTADFTNGSQYQLDDVVALLEENDGVGVFLMGHTAGSGDQAADQELSSQRAEAIRSYLIEAGIDGSRIQSRGYGSSQLMTTSGGDTDAANAHIEMYITEGGVSEPSAADLSSK
ncbi:cytochrome c oxidase subunit 2 [Lewinella marina]|uniref:Cytochrome c oxidase subunit 2 n=1 Tax=Neolewinella marina TaxID=438751 RepID=A0A2G0CIR2_9BACT|nr:OmpA family protein [Neolewinella marina]NJB85057.1 cytochrome c oxidase subunit 2 [Neolewinella marina]PHK99800.1 flagellar motor protein MotB [Neolewinella marina]